MIDFNLFFLKGVRAVKQDIPSCSLEHRNWADRFTRSPTKLELQGPHLLEPLPRPWAYLALQFFILFLKESLSLTKLGSAPGLNKIPGRNALHCHDVFNLHACVLPQAPKSSVILRQEGLFQNPCRVHKLLEAKTKPSVNPQREVESGTRQR